jgi:dTMP kinase
VSRGRFITLEGGEGAGKSTQIVRLAERLRNAGLDVVTTREPGGTPGAEAIRELIVNGDVARWDAMTETLLVNAARADHVARVIRPALEDGDWVVSDRYADSTFAYQGAGKGVAIEPLMALHHAATGELWPDLTLVIDVPVDIGLERAAARRGGATRFEGHDRDFHERIGNAFRDRAAADPARVRLIDGSASIDAVTAAIWTEVAPLVVLA